MQSLVDHSAKLHQMPSNAFALTWTKEPNRAQLNASQGFEASFDGTRKAKVDPTMVSFRELYLAKSPVAYIGQKMDEQVVKAT